MADAIEVIVIGAGPAGLALAIELGRRGRRVLIVERVERDGYKGPRTYLINNRSMELLRRWGIADRLRQRNPIDPDMAPDVIFCTRLNGHMLHRFERPFVGFGREEQFAENAEWIPQRTIEATLTEYAETLPSVRFLFGHELVSVEENGGDVACTIRRLSDSEETQLSARYFVGADGSQSMVRRAMGVRMEGKANLMHAFVYHIEAPGLKAISTVGLCSFYWFVNGSNGGYSGVLLNPADSEGRYSFGCFPSPPGLDPDNHDDLRRILYDAVGEETPVSFLSGRSYNMHALLAPTMRKGRMFLVGDAAHLLPNLGGFGFNVGLLDGVDLGWKLAAVLAGWGGDRLVDSFTIERHEALAWVAKVQLANLEILSHDIYRPGLEDDSPAGEQARREAAEVIVREKTQEFHSLGTQKGYRMTTSPVIVDDGSPPAPISPVDYIEELAARIGLPTHRWLDDGSSLYDHLGPEFTLLVKPGFADQLALDALARTSPLPAALYRLPAAAEGLFETELTMVRPDQVVAWRGNTMPSEFAKLFSTIAGRVN